MIRYILFDLDDTLYPTQAGLMHEISDRMSEYMIERVGISPKDVDRVRRDYWTRYGTTLRGLYIERHVDAQAFLNYVHEVDLTRYLKPDPRLAALLAALPQQKSIFTNAPSNYAHNVLCALEIEKYFDEIFDINFIAYESKPTPTAYVKVAAALPVRADECAMIDDTARNLVPAKELGMRTVWLDGNDNARAVEGSATADFVIKSIYDVTGAVQ
ncbi:MAG TPA: pyrimidine 5'-nucleotidase [Anaerolineae bacterium]